MTIVKINKRDTSYRMDVIGHAEYDTTGKDIVCSAVSALTLMFISLINKFESLDLVRCVEYNIEPGNVFVSFNYKNSVVDTVVETVKENLSELADLYPNNVKVHTL